MGAWQRTTRLALALVAGVVAVLLAALVLGLGDDRPPFAVDPERIASEAGGADDPLDFSEERAETLAGRAALGTSHPIYAKSPDGVVASAERTAQWRELVERAAARWRVDADTLEAMVLLESAGRPEVMADGTPHSATGLTQITPSAATELLGMRVDLERSTELTERIARAAERGHTELALRLAGERRRVDERFRPARALDGAARYLRIATDRFGSEELAVVSYHMGIGNLEAVIADFTGEEVGAERTAEVVDEHDLSYARLFFDSSPLQHERAWRRLAGFGDDSALYLWRVRASREIMRAWREDPEALAERAQRITAKATLEEHYHPEERTRIYEDADALAEARDEGELVEIPDDPELGFRITDQVGELADELGADRELYRALRPEALAALVHMAAKVKAISGVERPLRLTSAVRDRAYQEALVGVNAEATSRYSLHTTGWAFDIRRDYASEEQARAFQFVLDRMRAHALIDYAREPAAIHVTVSPLALELLRP